MHPGIGWTLPEAEAKYGNQISTVIKEQPVFFDVITNNHNIYPIGRIEVYISTTWWNHVNPADFSCDFTSCTGKPDKCAIRNTYFKGTATFDLDKPQIGKFYAKYENAGTYQPVVTYYIKNPTTGDCKGTEIIDTNLFVKVE